jgi:hypothetical protein
LPLCGYENRISEVSTGVGINELAFRGPIARAIMNKIGTSSRKAAAKLAPGGTEELWKLRFSSVLEYCLRCWAALLG